MRTLGQLEAKVMELLWSADGPLTVRELLTLMPPDRQRAYTTVMTVMDNLFQKGLLARDLVGKAYHYRPVTTRAEHAAATMEEVLSTSDSSQSTLLHFVGQLTPEEVSELRRALDAATEGDVS